MTEEKWYYQDSFIMKENVVPYFTEGRTISGQEWIERATMTDDLTSIG